MKYRNTNGETVEAIQFTASTIEACCQFVGRENVVNRSDVHIEIKRPTGATGVRFGDWITKDAGGLDVHKPKTFAATHKPAELNEFNEPGFDAEGPTDEELKERGIISEEE